MGRTLSLTDIDEINKRNEDLDLILHKTSRHAIKALIAELKNIYRKLDEIQDIKGPLFASASQSLNEVGKFGTLKEEIEQLREEEFEMKKRLKKIDDKIKVIRLKIDEMILKQRSKNQNGY